MEVKQTCDYRLCLQLATLYLPTKVTIYRFFLLLSLSSLRIHHPVFSAESLSLSSFALPSPRPSPASPFIPGQSGEKEKEREIEEAANCGWRLYSTPSSSVEDEGGEGGGGTGGAWSLGRNRGDVSVFLSSHLRTISTCDRRSDHLQPAPRCF